MTAATVKRLAPLLAALTSLALAAAGWIEADSERREKQALADNYGDYIRDQMEEEAETAAMERALDRCMERLAE